MESDLGWVEEWGEKGKGVGEMMRWMVEVFRVNGEEGEGGREGRAKVHIQKKRGKGDGNVKKNAKFLFKRVFVSFF